MFAKRLLTSLIACAVVAAPAYAQELTGTLKKIKDTNTISRVIVKSGV
jgi:hypothetical protein